MNGVVSHWQQTKEKQEKNSHSIQILLLWPDVQIDERKYLKGT